MTSTHLPPLVAALLLSGAFAAAHPQTGQRGAAKPDFTAARKLIAEHLAAGHYLSISVAAARNGEILWEEGFGLADRENQVPATPHTMYYTASVTKSFTETALMILHERKKLDLDRPANEYLGAGKLSSPAFDVSQATVRRVANHTAGLTTFNAARSLPIDETIRRYGVVFWPPGERFDYSNLGSIVLEEIVARASGRSFPEFLREEVLRPLGLTRTTWGLDPALEQHAAKRYVWEGSNHPPPGEGIYASAHDLVRFGMFHLKAHLPDQKPILSDAAIDAMQNSTVAAGNRRYGLSWWIEEDRYGYRSVFNQGGSYFDIAWLRLIPSEGIVVVVLMNRSSLRATEAVPEALVSALLPAYADRREQAATVAPAAPAPRPSESVPPEVYVGEWKGVIKTHRGDIPFGLSIGASGDVRVRLGPRQAALEGARFNSARLAGRIPGNLGIEDDREASRLEFSLYLRQGALQGAAVTQPGPSLPFWAELKRESVAGGTNPR